MRCPQGHHHDGSQSGGRFECPGCRDDEEAGGTSPDPWLLVQEEDPQARAVTRMYRQSKARMRAHLRATSGS